LSDTWAKALSPDRWRLALAVALTALAGFVDAVGFLKLGHLFVSFMSGDSTQFAVALARGDWGKMGAAGAIVGLFVVGVMAGRALEHAMCRWRRPAVLGLEASLLALALAAQTDEAATALMVGAMGVQNSAAHRAGEIRLSLTYVTGTLVHLGQSVVDAVVEGAEKRWGWAPFVALWAGLAGGAALGTAAFAAMGLAALLIPFCALVALAAATAFARPLRDARADSR
jgi:uncharacterized membrane protein YoaK (UPF0700 family)